MKNRQKFDNPTDFYRNRQGVWQTEPDIISDTFPKYPHPSPKYETIDQDIYFHTDQNIADLQNKHEIERKKELKTIKQFGISAIAMFSLLAAVYHSDKQNSTIDYDVNQVKLIKTYESNLDTTKDNPEKNYEKIIEEDGKFRLVTIEAGGAIRTNDTQYDPDFTNIHSALAQMENDTQYVIKGGDIYETPEGRIAVKSKNLEETFAGQKTGIKFNLDSDEWSVIDVPSSELQVIHDPELDDKYE